MLAVEKGIGREEAHHIIKKYAIAEALNLREGKEPVLAKKLSEDAKFITAKITLKDIQNILDNKEAFIGNAKKQIEDVSKKASELLKKYSKYAKYEPREIL